MTNLARIVAIHSRVLELMRLAETTARIYARVKRRLEQNNLKTRSN